MSLFIRPLTLADVPVADTIATTAFATPGSRSPEIQRYLALQPDGWFLACANDTPVGMGGAVDYGPFAYIGLMAVDPAHQRHGIGDAVMRHILGWLRERACPIVLLDASPFGAPIYTRLGFVTDDHSEVWRRNATTAPVPATSAGAMQLAADDLPELAAFDAPHFGADRAAVLAAFLAEFPGRVLGARDPDGQLTGFCVANPRTLGPWVAATPAAARALLASALALYAEPPQVLVPTANPHAAELLTAAGFTRQGVLQHMRLGDPKSRSRQTTYGLASFAIG